MNDGPTVLVVATGVLVFGFVLAAEIRRAWNTRHAVRTGSYERGEQQGYSDGVLVTWVHDTTPEERDAYRRMAASLAAVRRGRDNAAFSPAERGYFDGVLRALRTKGTS